MTAAYFVTTDPRSGGGLTMSVGSEVVFVSISSSVATRLRHYGSGANDWVAVPGGGTEVVTADPRSGGLSRKLGAEVVYVTGGVPAVLVHYDTGSTDWIAWSTQALLPEMGASGTVLTSNGEGLAPSWETPTGGSGVSDGDKGDITVSVSGSQWTIDNDAVTYAKIQNVSATDKVLGRSTAGAGNIEEIDCTAAGRALLDDANAAAQRTTLGLGTAAVVDTGTGSANVPTIAQADARYPSLGKVVAMAIAPPWL